MAIEKAALRKSMIELREGFSPAFRAHAAGAVAAHAEALLGTAAGLEVPQVSTFWAIGPEIDPVSLEAALVARGAQLCLPVMMGKTKPLEFRRYAHGDEVRERMWGIREPLASAPVVDPDVVLVPLLAVDLSGARLGYGGGFYDRTLGALRQRKTIAAVGLCYDEQVVDAVPHLHYDERIDWILTPTGLRRCRPPAA